MKSIIRTAVFATLLCSLGLAAHSQALPDWLAARTTATQPYGATDYFILAQGGISKKVLGTTLVTTSDTQTLTNKTVNCANNTCTVRIATDVSGLGTGVATFLGTPSSANLAAALTDETGSGLAVFGTSPSLTTPTIAGGALSGTFSGSPTFSGTGITLSGAATGTQNRCLGLTSGGVLATSSGACSSGGGASWDITDGTHTVTSVTTLTVGNGSVVGGSAGSATLNPTNTTNAQSGATYTIQTTDNSASVLMTNASATTVTMLGVGTAGTGFAFTLVCDAGCTVNRAGSDTINGATSLALNAKQMAWFMSPASGTDWRAGIAVPSTAVLAYLNVEDQTQTGGTNVTSKSLGTVSSGTTTIDCGARPLQYLTNGGAFTLAAPANDGNCIVLSTNNGSAGTITFSGFSVPSNTGDALDTTNGHKFSISVWRVNSVAGYRVAAHQ